MSTQSGRKLISVNGLLTLITLVGLAYVVLLILSLMCYYYSV